MPDTSAQVQQSQAMANAQIQQSQAMANAVITQANAAMAASQPHIEGSLTVNGNPFALTRCITGQFSGFNGVDVMTVDSSRLRLVQEVDGSGTVIQMGTGAAPVTMKGCAKINVQPSNMTVNGVRILSGTAQVDCTSGPLHVAGNVTFQCGV